MKEKANYPNNKIPKIELFLAFRRKAKKEKRILPKMTTESNHLILNLSDGNTFLDAFMQIASLPLGESQCSLDSRLDDSSGEDVFFSFRVQSSCAGGRNHQPQKRRGPYQSVGHG